jgi:hypothetical protein
MVLMAEDLSAADAAEILAGLSKLVMRCLAHNSSLGSIPASSDVFNVGAAKQPARRRSLVTPRRKTRVRLQVGRTTRSGALHVHLEAEVPGPTTTTTMAIVKRVSKPLAKVLAARTTENRVEKPAPYKSTANRAPRALVPSRRPATAKASSSRSAAATPVPHSDTGADECP